MSEIAGETVKEAGATEEIKPVELPIETCAQKEEEYLRQIANREQY